MGFILNKHFLKIGIVKKYLLLRGMEQINTQIEYYSEILEDDLIIKLSVNFDRVEVGYPKFTCLSNEEEEISLEAHFLVDDITVLNTELSDNVINEFLNDFDHYYEEIREEIENQINII